MIKKFKLMERGEMKQSQAPTMMTVFAQVQEMTKYTDTEEKTL